MAGPARRRDGHVAGGTRQRAHGKSAGKKLSSVCGPAEEKALSGRPHLRTARISFPAYQRVRWRRTSSEPYGELREWKAHTVFSRALRRGAWTMTRTISARPQ